MSHPVGGPGEDEVGLERCADCGDELDPERGRGFSFGSDAALCFSCAVARGGCWDERRERWVVEPDTADLGAAG